MIQMKAAEPSRNTVYNYYSLTVVIAFSFRWMKTESVTIHM